VKKIEKITALSSSQISRRALTSSESRKSTRPSLSQYTEANIGIQIASFLKRTVSLRIVHLLRW